MQTHVFRVPTRYGVPVRRFLMSDLHLGTIFCDETKIKHELATACDLGCRILINGDVFDAVVCTDSKRFEAGQMIPALESAKDYVAACVKYARDLLAPYAENIDIIGVGNHETSFLKYHKANPVRHLITALNLSLADAKSSHRIRYGGYEGWIVTQLEAQSGESRRVFCHRLYYHHGSGGSAPVTKGQIDKARMNEDVDADCMTFGHKHNATRTEIVRRGISSQGKTFNRRVLLVQTGSYFRNHVERTQNEDADDISYAARGRHGNKPFGGRVLTLCLKRTDEGHVIQQFDHAVDMPMGESD